jgi:CRP/FNR family transcriptional regulator, cyclic AMP receptor protein
MTHWDVIGYLASILVFAAFGMKEMVRLRMVAMSSNIAFIVYGLGLGLTPVWLLHAVLLPLNVWRLVQETASRGEDEVNGSGGAWTEASIPTGLVKRFDA